jgi:hypothetical protein
LKKTGLKEHIGGQFTRVSREEAAWGAALPGDEPPIPNIRANFPCFGLKIVEHSRYLPNGGLITPKSSGKASEFWDQALFDLFDP